MAGNDGGSCSEPASNIPSLLFDPHTIHENSTVLLNDGHSMPIIGLGGGIFTADAEEAFVSALGLGYRLIDTSPKYGISEAAIGRAIKRSDLPRADLFLASKVSNAGYEATRQSLEASLVALQTPYLDLLLIHSAIHQPSRAQPRSRLHATNRNETWRAMVDLRKAGRVRSIGVANFSPRQIAQLEPPPAVVQVEHHPLLQRADTLRYCREHRIAVQAYGSGGGGWHLWKKDASLDVLRTEPVQAAATAHGRSATQVSLRWALEQGACVIPKAASPAHQEENRRLFDFRLTDAQHAALNALDAQRSIYRFKEPDDVA